MPGCWLGHGPVSSAERVVKHALLQSPVRCSGWQSSFLSACGVLYTARAGARMRLGGQRAHCLFVIFCTGMRSNTFVPVNGLRQVPN